MFYLFSVYFVFCIFAFFKKHVKNKLPPNVQYYCVLLSFVGVRPQRVAWGRMLPARGKSQRFTFLTICDLFGNDKTKTSICYYI